MHRLKQQADLRLQKKQKQEKGGDDEKQYTEVFKKLQGEFTSQYKSTFGSNGGGGDGEDDEDEMEEEEENYHHIGINLREAKQRRTYRELEEQIYITDNAGHIINMNDTKTPDRQGIFAVPPELPSLTIGDNDNLITTVVNRYNNNRLIKNNELTGRPPLPVINTNEIRMLPKIPWYRTKAKELKDMRGDRQEADFLFSFFDNITSDYLFMVNLLIRLYSQLQIPDDQVVFPIRQPSLRDVDNDKQDQDIKSNIELEEKPLADIQWNNSTSAKDNLGKYLILCLDKADFLVYYALPWNESRGFKYLIKNQLVPGYETQIDVENEDDLRKVKEAYKETAFEFRTIVSEWKTKMQAVADELDSIYEDGAPNGQAFLNKLLGAEGLDEDQTTLRFQQYLDKKVMDPINEALKFLDNRLDVAQQNANLKRELVRATNRIYKLQQQKGGGGGRGSGGGGGSDKNTTTLSNEPLIRLSIIDSLHEFPYFTFAELVAGGLYQSTATSLFLDFEDAITEQILHLVREGEIDNDSKSITMSLPRIVDEFRPFLLDKAKAWKPIVHRTFNEVMVIVEMMQQRSKQSCRKIKEEDLIPLKRDAITTDLMSCTATYVAMLIQRDAQISKNISATLEDKKALERRVSELNWNLRYLLRQKGLMVNLNPVEDISNLYRR